MVLKQVLSDLTVDFPPLELLLSCKTPCDINALVSMGEGKATEGIGSRYTEGIGIPRQIFEPPNLNSVKIEKAVPLQILGKANWFPAQFEPQLHPIPRLHVAPDSAAHRAIWSLNDYA